MSGLAPLLFSFILGGWVDRFNTKKIIVYTEIIRSILYLGFILVPIFDGLLSWFMFILIRFLTGIMTSLSTIARQTILPDLIEKDDLIVANSLNFSISSSIRLIGAAVGGTFISFIDINIFWIITSFAFIVSAILINSINYKSTKKINSTKNIIEEVKIGIMFVKNQNNVKLVLLAALTGGLIIGSFNLMIEQIVSNIYLTKSYRISLLYISEGIVSVIIGYWLANKKKLFKNRRNYGYIYMLMGISWGLFGFTQNILEGMLVLMLFAFVGGFVVPFERFIMQTDVETELRGRIFGLWNTCSMISIQIGAFLTGVIIHYVGMAYAPMVLSIFEILLGVYFVKKVGKNELDYSEKIPIPYN